MDTSVANPLYIMKGTGKNDKSYLTSFKIVNDEEMGDVTPIPDSDIKETNSENNTDYHYKGRCFRKIRRCKQ